MLALTNSAQVLSKCISLEASIETIIPMVITTPTRTFNLTVSTPTAHQTTRFPPDLNPEIRRAAKRQNEQFTFGINKKRGVNAFASMVPAASHSYRPYSPHLILAAYLK
jgi:hypothetical protein